MNKYLVSGFQNIRTLNGNTCFPYIEKEVIGFRRARMEKNRLIMGSIKKVNK